MEPNRIVREPERKEITGVPTTTWWELVEDGLALPGVKISKSAVGWPLDELEQLNAARIAGKREEQIKLVVRRLLDARTHAFDRYDGTGAAL